MNKPRMILYAGLGSLVSVLIWSFIGGCHIVQDQTKEPTRVESALIEKKAPEAVETEEVLIEEGILKEKKPKNLPEGEKSPVASAPAEPSSPVPQTRIHTVSKGDTLWAISHRYQVSVQAIQEANGISEPDRLSIGQQLRIPLGSDLRNTLEINK